jgi:hypothetical protein
MEPKKRQPLGQRIKITLVVLGVVLVALFVFLVRDYLSLRRANLINRRELSLSAFVQKNGTLNSTEVGVIHPWMTFDYINRIFNLPQNYLKDQLHVSNPHYPNITLGSYASAENLNTSETVHDVQNAIVNYFKQGAL